MLAPCSLKTRIKCGPTVAFVAISTLNLPLFVSALNTIPGASTHTFGGQGSNLPMAATELVEPTWTATG